MIALKKTYGLRGYVFLFVLFGILLFGCSKAPAAKDFFAPSIAQTFLKDVGHYAVTVVAPLEFSNNESLLAENCEYGFYFYPDKNSSSCQIIPATVKDGGLVASLDNLSIGITYKCVPFVKQDGFEVLGKEFLFSTLDPFEDAIFKKYIIDNFDNNRDGGISQSEAATVVTIDVQKMGITSLKGVELFAYLKYIYCGTNKIKELDLKANPLLTELCAEVNLIEKLDLRENKELRNIVVWENKLTTIDVSGLELVVSFWCWNNKLNEIDISSMKELIYFGCAQNAIKVLDLSNNTKLLNLAPNNTFIEELDLSSCPNLESLDIQGNINMAEVNLSLCPKIRFFRSEACNNLRFVYIKKGQKIEQIIKDDHTMMVELD